MRGVGCAISSRALPCPARPAAPAAHACPAHLPAHPLLPPPCSPEIREGWASYDAKVDLFSLGVMTFEVWHPFATAMERAVLLRDLREHGVMPAPFEARHPIVCRLIRWLLGPNPAERPTAVEVLRSELLPPQASGAGAVGGLWWAGGPGRWLHDSWAHTLVVLAANLPRLPLPV